MRIALVDTNLLVLLAVGYVDTSLIEKHKRTSQFTVEDFTLLTRILSPYQKIYITPNIATEASNLCRQCGDPMKSHVQAALKQIIDESFEIYVASATSAAEVSYSKLGLTDAGIHLTDPSVVSFTTDLDLYLSLISIGREAFNFNHLRENNWASA